MNNHYNHPVESKISLEENQEGLIIINKVEIEPINIVASIIAVLGLLTTFYIQFQIITIIFGIGSTPIFVKVFLVAALIFLLFWQKRVLGAALFFILNKEVLKCNNKQIIVKKEWELFTKRKYETSKIQKLKYEKTVYEGLVMKKYNSTYNKFMHKNISFRFGLEIMTFGVDVSESDAEYVLKTLVEKGIVKQEQLA